MDSKRYYWIKLKTDFFSRDTIDFLLSQNNGCEYVVLYQMLCLNTANNNGQLATNIGEMIVPYDVEKIARDTKYFTEDTIRVALELYKQLGLIYEGDNNLLQIAEFNDLVGSETSWAEKKRTYREKQKGQLKDIVREENRDKRLEYRDKSIDIDIYKYIVDYLNQKTGKNFKVNSNKTKSLIKARLNEGFTKEDFVKVIDIKTNEWLKTKMEQYLRPETLFSNKFEGYLNQNSGTPNWLNKDIKAEEISDDELKELEEMMRDFK